MSTFQLDIVTPESNVYSGEVQSVTVPGTLGSFQVLVNHAPIISTLGKGRLKFVKAGGEEVVFSVEDGVVEVLNNKAIVLVERLAEAV